MLGGTHVLPNVPTFYPTFFNATKTFKDKKQRRLVRGALGSFSSITVGALWVKGG